MDRSKGVGEVATNVLARTHVKLAQTNERMPCGVFMRCMSKRLSNSMFAGMNFFGTAPNPTNRQKLDLAQDNHRHAQELK
jgi:hypothetical protein